MSEETFAYIALAFIFAIGGGIGLFFAYIEPIERWQERRKKKRAAKLADSEAPA